jgi:hypothetical protein
MELTHKQWVAKIEAAMVEAHDKALANLARYKFSNFGYWAAEWVKLNKLLPKPQPSPFTALVKLAREIKP